MSVLADARRLARALAGPTLMVALYLACRLAFAAATVDDGLLTPRGTPAMRVVLLGGVTMLLRLAAVFAAPAWLAWKAGSWAVGRFVRDRRRG